MKKLALISLALLTLSACGGSGNEVESLDELGQMLEDQGIDCSELEADSEEIMVREGGRCEDVSVYVFNDSENRDAYLEIAQELGGGPYVMGSNWLVEVPDQAQADELASSLDAETP